MIQSALRHQQFRYCVGFKMNERGTGNPGMVFICPLCNLNYTHFCVIITSPSVTPSCVSPFRAKSWTRKDAARGAKAPRDALMGASGGGGSDDVYGSRLEQQRETMKGEQVDHSNASTAAVTPLALCATPSLTLAISQDDIFRDPKGIPSAIPRLGLAELPG